MRSVTDSASALEHHPQPTRRGQKRCPHCRNTLRFSSHYPVLTGCSALFRNGAEAPDRLVYVVAWVCQDHLCSYWELSSESTVDASDQRDHGGGRAVAPVS